MKLLVALALLVSFALPPGAASAGERVTHFGSFTLVDDDPSTIYLEGEIDTGTAFDFFRALRKRPEATTVVLSSDGGFVDQALLIAHEIEQRGLDTYVPAGYSCYSACAYLFLAGVNRKAVGELGVHQVSGEALDVAGAQSTLSDVLDALHKFGVEQDVVSLMLRTPPESMYIFRPDEISVLGLNRTPSRDFAGLDAAYVADVAPPPAERAVGDCQPIDSHTISLHACVASEWVPGDGIGAQEFVYLTADQSFGLMVITESEFVARSAFREAIIQNAIVGSGASTDDVEVLTERQSAVDGRKFDVILYTIPNDGDPILFQNFYYSDAGLGALQILAYSLVKDGFAAASRAELFLSTVDLGH